MDDFDEFSLITKLNRQEFIHILTSIPGYKELIVEQNLLRPLDKICSMSILQSHDCLHVQQLPMEQPISWKEHVEQRLFFVRPTIDIARRICELIRSSPRNPYTIILAGSRQKSFDYELEKNGLFGIVNFLEFELTLVHLESDLFSLELPQYSPDTFKRYYILIAKALWKLQILYGQIQTFFGIGACFDPIEKEFKHLCAERGEPSASADQPISHVFLFDRRFDLISPLLTCFTYESILNDVFQYKCGKISIRQALNTNIIDVSGNNKENKTLKSTNLSGVFAMNNLDSIFSSIRNSHMTVVFPFLRSKAKMLQASFAKVSAIQCIGEVKSFVSTELSNLKEQQKQLEFHIFTCEYILSQMNGANERFNIERAIITGNYEDTEIAAFLNKLISAKCNHWTVLQLACLWSLRSQGIKSNRIYRQFQETFLHRYGFEKLSVLYKLREYGLLYLKDFEGFGIVQQISLPIFGKNVQHDSRALDKDLASSKGRLVNSIALNNNVAHFPTLSQLVNGFKLCPPEIVIENREKDAEVKKRSSTSSKANGSPEEQERKRRNMAYVFSDSYIPLISHIVQKTVTTGWDETRLKRVLGERAVHCTNPAAKPPDNRIRRAILVCFVGGVTYAEIGSLRRFAQDHDFRLIIITTHIINREEFLSSYSTFFH